MNIVCGLPFCQSSTEQTKLSCNLRIVVLIVGILEISLGFLVLHGQFKFLNTTGGWIVSTCGILTTLTAASIKCVENSTKIDRPLLVKKPIDRTRKPLIIPRPVDAPIPLEVIQEFRRLKKGSAIWIDEARKQITLGACLGFGGSKLAMEISEDEVLMLPNTGISFDAWRRVVDEEVQVSDRLTDLGICTVLSKRVDLYLSEDSIHPLPAYICPSFKSLAEKGQYVIDIKKPESSCFKGKSFFRGKEVRFDVSNWLPIIKPLIIDLYTMAKYDCLFTDDSLNIIIIEHNNSFIARYFGFDFSTKSRSLTDDTYGYLDEDVTSRVAVSLYAGITHLFYAQLNFDSGEENFGLTHEYQSLRNKIKDQCPEIIKQMIKDGTLFE